MNRKHEDKQMKAWSGLRCAVVALIVSAVAPLASAQTVAAGDVVSSTAGSSDLAFTLSSGAAGRVEIIDGETVRVRIAPTGVFSALSTGAVITTSRGPLVSTFDTADVVYMVATRAIVAVLKHPLAIVIWRADGSLVQADAHGAVTWDATSGTVSTRKFAPADEHYFGFGERGGPLDARGRRFLMWNTDWAGYGEFSNPLYISIPVYWGLRGGQAYGVFVDNSAVPFFDADPDSTGVFTFGALNGELDYYVMTGPTPADVARQYAAITGAPQLPPKWTLGYHQSRYGYASQNEILTIAATLRTQRFPADVLYFDIDYLDALQMFTWNPATFPDPFWMNATLDQFGFKRVNIMEPLVRVDDRMWNALASAGYFVRNAGGSPAVNNVWYGMVSWLDFTQPRVASWYSNLLQAFLATGVSAVWNDLNEPAQNYMGTVTYLGSDDPSNTSLARSELQGRNLYAFTEAGISYDAQQRLRPGVRPWVLSRSGFAGIQRYAANWGGDESSTFDSLRVSVAMSQNMAISGQNQFGHDIGGFLGAPSAELFLRWMAFSAYTPLFRNHAMNTSPPREPWGFGEPYASMARSLIEEHYRLLPYLYTAMADATFTGAPALAPLLFHFPFDEATYRADTEFMLGPSLLVAPVVTEAATSRTAYLPAGSDWFEEATDRLFGGGASYTVDAPLDRAPVFVRAGAVVPKGPIVQYTDERPLTEPRLHLYSGPATTFSLYEDDGATTAFAGGAYLWTSISRRDLSSGAECQIQRGPGTWTPPSGRAWSLEFHGLTGTAASATSNGVALPQFATEADLIAAGSGWTITAAGHVLVRVPDSDQPIVVRVTTGV